MLKCGIYIQQMQILRPKRLKYLENTNKTIPTVPKVLPSITQFFFQNTPILYFLGKSDNIPFNKCYFITAQHKNLKYFFIAGESQCNSHLKFIQNGSTFISVTLYSGSTMQRQTSNNYKLIIMRAEAEQIAIQNINYLRKQWPAIV